MALPMNVSGLRRNIKNIAHNYTDAQVKVREATSNDPWGPSSTIMSEIADLTYNVVAFSEIMQMVWKRLNDHGKNWRHVYKALVLLEYLIKTGSEKVAEQSRENIHSISTLKDFQYIEEGKDQGINVREKAKAMVALLKDDERLRNERVRALKAKERFAQSVSGITGDPSGRNNNIEELTITVDGDQTLVTSSSRTERDSYGVRERPTDYGELESARPHTVGEEELQLQLALAMSKEEADHEEARRRSDDVRLQMALNESKDEKSDDGSLVERQGRQEPQDRSGINDLLDINFNPPQNNGAMLGAVGGLGLGSPLSPPSASRDPWGLSPPGAPSNDDPQVDPWGAAPPRATASPAAVVATLAPDNDPWSPTPPAPAVAQPVSGTGNDPWAPVPAPAPAPVPTADPWAAVKSTSPLENSQPDPFAPLSIQQQPQQLLPLDDFSALTNREKPTANDAVFNLTGLDDALPSASRASPAKSRSPASFLGENSNLVNLDNLVASKSSAAGMASSSTLSSSSPNLNAAGVGKSFSLTPQPNTLLFSSTNTLNTSNTNPFTASGTPGISPIINYNNNNNNNMNVALSSGFAYGLSTGASNVHRSMSPLPTSVSGLGTSFYSASPPLTLTNTTAINNNNNNNNSLVIDSSIPSLSQDSFTGANPFCGSMMGGAVGGLGGTGGGAGGIVPNPFQAAQSPKPSINQLRASAGGGFNDPWGAAPQNNGIDGLTGKGNDPF